MRVVCCLAILLLSTDELAADNQRKFVSIPLKSSDHLRFTGIVHLGSPPQKVRVVFDTGSSDTWFTIKFAAVNEGRGGKIFTIGYGGGIVSGLATRNNLELSRAATDGFLLRQVPVGVVDDHISVIPELDAQGVVGLGMENLAQIHSNSSLLSLLAQHESLTKSLVFSIYISSWAGAQPESQLILGSDIPSLTSVNKTWFNFSVISARAFHNPQSPSQTAHSMDSFGFWALRMQSFSFDNVVLSRGEPNSHNCVALLDSGTSVLLLPHYAFDRVIQSLFFRFGTRLLHSPNERTLPACRPCQVREFPPFAFDFMEDSTKPDATTQRFQLRGSDYVRCDQRRRECTIMIDSIHSSELSDHLDVVILGIVFIRAHYSRFDYTNKLVSLACTLNNNGICPGGLQPALDYYGKPYNEVQQANRSWAGFCAATTTLALFAAVRILLQSFEKSGSSSSSSSSSSWTKLK